MTEFVQHGDQALQVNWAPAPVDHETLRAEAVTAVEHNLDLSLAQQIAFAATALHAGIGMTANNLLRRWQDIVATTPTYLIPGSNGDTRAVHILPPLLEPASPVLRGLVTLGLTATVLAAPLSRFRRHKKIRGALENYAQALGVDSYKALPYLAFLKAETTLPEEAEIDQPVEPVDKAVLPPTPPELLSEIESSNIEVITRSSASAAMLVHLIAATTIQGCLVTTVSRLSSEVLPAALQHNEGRVNVSTFLALLVGSFTATGERPARYAIQREAQRSLDEIEQTAYGRPTKQ